MVNMPFAEEAIQLAKSHKIPTVGLHLNVTLGEKAIIPIKKYYSNLLLFGPITIVAGRQLYDNTISLNVGESVYSFMVKNILYCIHRSPK